MKSPVIFIASFEQPCGALNPGGWKLPGPVWVEVFHHKVGPPAEWKARRRGTVIVFEKISAQSQAATLRNQILGVYFEKQLSPWKAFDATIPERPEELKQDEWSMDSQGKVFINEIRRKRVSEALIAETNRKMMEKNG